MEKVIVTNEEDVVRILLSVKKDGTIRPNSFKLREWPEPKGPERYISVNRYDAVSLVADLRKYDQGRNLPCAKLNVGEVRGISLFIGANNDNPVLYDVRDMQSDSIPSHAGIFITVGGIALEGSGDSVFNEIEEGKDKESYVLAIRQKLVDIAFKTVSTVETICREKESQEL